MPGLLANQKWFYQNSFKSIPNRASKNRTVVPFCKLRVIFRLSFWEIPMKIGIPAETRPGETRVAATPETVKKLVAAKHQVVVQAGAGVAASITDEAYAAAGAEIVSADHALGADLVLRKENILYFVEEVPDLEIIPVDPLITKTNQ
jgi:hypothetical protein